MRGGSQRYKHGLHVYFNMTFRKAEWIRIHSVKTRKDKCVKNKHHHHKLCNLFAVFSTNSIKIEIKGFKNSHCKNINTIGTAYVPDIWKLLDIIILSILLALSNLNLQLQMSYYHLHFEIFIFKKTEDFAVQRRKATCSWLRDSPPAPHTNWHQSPGPHWAALSHPVQPGFWTLVDFHRCAHIFSGSILWTQIQNWKGLKRECLIQALHITEKETEAHRREFRTAPPGWRDVCHLETKWLVSFTSLCLYFLPTPHVRSYICIQILCLPVTDYCNIASFPWKLPKCFNVCFSGFKNYPCNIPPPLPLSCSEPLPIQTNKGSLFFRGPKKKIP